MSHYETERETEPQKAPESHDTGGTRQEHQEPRTHAAQRVEPRTQKRPAELETGKPGAEQIALEEEREHTEKIIK